MIFNSKQGSPVRPSVNGSWVIPIIFIRCNKSLLAAKNMMKCKSTCWITTCLSYVCQYINDLFQFVLYICDMISENILTYWKWYNITNKLNNIGIIHLTLLLYQFSHEFPCIRFVQYVFSQTSKISRAFVGSKIVDHSDAVGVWRVRAPSTPPAFST